MPMRERGFKLPAKARGCTFVQAERPTNPQYGDTWYNTDNGIVYLYCEGGWVYFQGPPSECTSKNAPSVVISPASATISEDGGYVDLTVTITNTDEGLCGVTTFSIQAVDSNTTDFEPSSVDPTTVELSPTQSATVTLRVRDRTGAATGDGVNNVYVRVTAADHPDAQSNTATVQLTGEAYSGCIARLPDLSASPSNQTITEDGGTATYTITITNQDSSSCSPTTFSLSVSDSNTTDFEPSTLSQTSVTLEPGASADVTLTVKDRLGAASNADNTTTVLVEAPGHPSASIPVVTTLDGEALTGWTKNAPSLSITPTSQTISTDGGSVNYTVTITNNDTGASAQAVTFTLQAVDDNSTDFEASTLSQTSVTLNPGDSTTVTLTVTDKVGDTGGSGVNHTYVTATAPDHPTAQSNTVTTSLTVSNWVKNAPSLSISPSSRTISDDGTTAVYTVTITNEDTGDDAQAVTFSLQAIDDNTTGFYASTLSNYSVTLNPGESTSVYLYVKDRPGGTSNTVNHTYVQATEADHPTGISNTVTTYLTGEAATGWVKNAPNVSASPTSGDISEDGGSFSYTITIENTDTGVGAQAVTYSLSVSDSNTTDFEASTLSQTSVTLNPGESTTVTLTVTDKVGSASDTQNITTVTASAPDHPDGSTQVTTTLSGSAATGCSVAAPSVVITPSSQTIISDGGSVTYTVTITNNDTGAGCSPVTFTATVYDSNTTDFQPSVLSQTSGTLDPGESGNVTLTVRDRVGHYPGPTSNETYIVVTAEGHPDAQSNTVTTTLAGGAAYPHDGYICGGSTANANGAEISTVDRLPFPFTVGSTVHSTDLSGTRHQPSACASSQHGYVCGGAQTTAPVSTFSIIDRFAFPFFSGTATHISYLMGGTNDAAAGNSSTHGYVAAGQAQGALSLYTSVYRFAFPLDSGVATHTSNTAAYHYAADAGCSSSVALYVMAGENTNGYIERGVFPLDSGTMVIVGQTSVELEETACNSSKHGFTCGGQGPTATCTRITFPFTSGTAVSVGSLSTARSWAAALESTVFGYVCGGLVGAAPDTTTSSIERLTFPFDSGTATSVGNLTVASCFRAGNSSADPHLRWNV